MMLELVVAAAMPHPHRLRLSGVEACIAWAESRNEVHVVNASSGAAGLFQYLDSTWTALGYARRFGVASAAYATRREQILAFRDTVKRYGYTPWAGDPCVRV